MRFLGVWELRGLGLLGKTVRALLVKTRNRFWGTTSIYRNGAYVGGQEIETKEVGV
jgi:hypothetical protein